MNLLKNRVAIVTGASRGIGKAVAEKFAANGANLVLCSRNKNYEFINRLKDSGTQAIYVEGDLANCEVAEKIVKMTADNFGRIDILANIAGISPKDEKGMKIPFYEIPNDVWDRVFAVNLNSMFYLTKAVSKIMIKNKYGRIINMSSIVGLTNSEHGPACAAYSTSKSAVIGYTKAIAYELAEFGITVNAIAGGRIDTEMSKENNEYYNELHKKLIPMHKFGNVNDIANAFLYYAMEESGYVTGDVMNITGGWYI